MPQSQHYYEPDQIDCCNLIRSIREDFNCDPVLETTLQPDHIVTICRCRKYGQPGGDVVQVQALVKTPHKAKRSCWVLFYGALLDCWHQLDRGVLGAATRPVEHGWNGRPTVPRRHVQ